MAGRLWETGVGTGEWEGGWSGMLVGADTGSGVQSWEGGQ